MRSQYGGPLAQTLQRISGGALLMGLMAIATISALALSLSVLNASNRADTDQLHRIGERLQEELRDAGLSGLTQMLVDLQNTAFLSNEQVEIAVWRLRPDGKLLHRSTSPAFAAATSGLAPGSRTIVELDDRNLNAHVLDIAAASPGWALPMSDVSVAFGLPSPSHSTGTAWATVGTVWMGLGFTLIIGLLLHANHTRRYRDGLLEINTILERFSAGDTRARLPADPLAPELRVLAQNVNAVLPRIDELITGLRYLSAHMAHEMKTPLQVIRSELSRLMATSDADSRSAHANGIETTIDIANGRLHSLMQLFRLEARAPVVLTEKINLSRLVEYAADDFMDALESQNRSVRLNIAPDLLIAGNRALIEVLISNLVGNANKYAIPGSEVRMTAQAEGGNFMLSVANTGSSFAPDVAERAFELFSRSTATIDLPGVGIGLSLVKAISQRHGFQARITPSNTMAEVVISGPLFLGSPSEAKP